MKALLLHLSFCIAAPFLLFAQNRELLGEYKIGFVGRDKADAIYQAAHLGAKDAALELSQKYSIDVELLISTPESSQGGTQPESLTELFIENADGFVISPTAKEVTISTIEFAMQQGQEVVFFESAIESLQPLASLLADEAAAGRLAAKALLKELPTKGRVAILTSNQSSVELEQRLEGARSVLGYRRIETIVETAPDYRSAIARISEAETNDRNDRIKGWLFLEDWPLLGMPALPWEAGELPVVAIQSSPSAFIYTDQGYLNALIVHPYYEWGYQSVATVIEKLHLNQTPSERTILTEPKTVDWRNIESYRENWMRWFK